MTGNYESVTTSIRFLDLSEVMHNKRCAMLTAFYLLPCYLAAFYTWYYDAGFLLLIGWTMLTGCIAGVLTKLFFQKLTIWYKEFRITWQLTTVMI